MPTSPVEVAVTHLNASIGRVLSAEQLSAALKAGSLSAIDDPTASAAAAYLFVETSPSLIAACARAAGADLAHAHMLYRETLEQHMARVPAWEQSLEHLL